MAKAIERFAFGREPATSRDQRPVTTLVARILLSLIFVISGVLKIVAWDATAAMMQAEGMVAVPLFLLGALALELLGGLSVMTGTYARIGAAALIVFLIPVTLVFHDFWVYEGAEQQMQMANFLRNVALVGGLLLVIAQGAGRYSVDARLEQGRRRA